jgi:hypothetical protein
MIGALVMIGILVLAFAVAGLNDRGTFKRLRVKISKQNRQWKKFSSSHCELDKTLEKEWDRLNSLCCLGHIR